MTLKTMVDRIKLVCVMYHVYYCLFYKQFIISRIGMGIALTIVFNIYL